MEKFLTLNLQKKIPLFLAPKCLCVLFAPPILIVLKNPPFLPASFSYKQVPKVCTLLLLYVLCAFFQFFLKTFFLLLLFQVRLTRHFPLALKRKQIIRYCTNVNTQRVNIFLLNSGCQMGWFKKRTNVLCRKKQ